MELADETGVVRHRPKRYVSFSGHSIVFAKAKKLEGMRVTTRTSNSIKNPPEDWWIDVDAYKSETNSTSKTSDHSSTKYTEEQEKCIEIFHSSSDQLKISAFAGTGKTTTLLGIANSAPKQRGIYLAFNREIAEEAQKKFPKNIECRTTHSLAYQFAAANYSREKLGGALNAVKVAEFLSLEPVNFGPNREYSPRQVGAWVLDTLAAYCRSDAWRLGHEHVTCSRLDDLNTSDEVQNFTDFLLKCATYIWEHARDPNSPIPLGHEGYLKLWSISNPQFNQDFIMLDEAQDTNAAVIQALTSQKVKTVYVGDKYQQIYGFRGAFNAMDRIHVASESSLTTSFRFGQSIADVANAIIGRFRETRRIIGNPSVTSSVNSVEGTTKIYRTNIGLLSGLAGAIQQNKRPSIAGGTTDLTSMIHDIEMMQSGQQAISHPEFFGFKNWLDLESFAQTSEGRSYQTIVQIIQKYGALNLKKMLEGVAPNESEADLVLTTAHKSKGKEWSHVEVCDDFASDSRIRSLQQSTYSFADSSVEEITLLYVALTRGKISLNISDRILEVLDLARYFRDPFSSLREISINRTPIGSQHGIQANGALPLKPVLPGEFSKFKTPARNEISLPQPPAVTESLHKHASNPKLHEEEAKDTKTPPDGEKLQALMKKFSR